MQLHQSSLVFGMNVRPLGEKKLDDPDPVVAGGEVQRGAVTTLQVPAVDDVRVTQDYFLDQLEITWRTKNVRLERDKNTSG